MAKRIKCLGKSILAAAATLALAQGAKATQYTYTPGATPDSWTAGTDWGGVPPVSAATTELTFDDKTGTSLVTAGQNYVSVDDISGAFSLNLLDLGGLGAASGGASTITINSTSPATGLSFTGTGAAINVYANAGTAGLGYVINAPITISSATAINMNGTGSLNIGGSVALGANALTIGGTGVASTNPGILTISGNISGTGPITINQVANANTNTVILSGNQSATGGNYSGIISVKPTVASTISVLSIRSTTALGGAGIFLGPTPNPAVDSSAILEIGAKIGADPSADFAMLLTTAAGTAQAGRIAFQNSTNNFAGEGFAAWGTNGNNGGTLNNRIVALGGSAAPTALVEKTDFGAGGGDHFTFGSPTANGTLILKNSFDLNGAPNRQWQSIRGVGIVPEGQLDGKQTDSTGNPNTTYSGNGGIIFTNTTSTVNSLTMDVIGGAIFIGATDNVGVTSPLGSGTSSMNLGAANPNGIGIGAFGTTGSQNIAFMSYGGSAGVGGSPTITSNRAINVTNNGTGTMTIGGFTNDYSAFSGLVSLGKATIFTAGNGGRVDFTGVVSGTGALTIGNTTVEGDATTPGISVTGNGIVSMGGANTYNGGTTITNGTVLASISNSTTVNGALGPSTSAVTLGAASGSNSPSLLTNGAITFANNITVATGTSGTLTLGGGSANASIISGTVTLNHPLTLSQVSGGSVTFSGVISGAAANTVTVAAAGTGVVALSNTGNSFSGNINVTGGFLSALADGNLGTVPGSTNPVAITLAGGSLQATSNFTMNTARGITLGTGGGGLDVTGSNVFNYAGIITGGTALAKTNSGTANLSGINSYTGPTNVNQGTLGLGSGGSLANTAVTVGNGSTNNATLQVNSAYTIGTGTGASLAVTGGTSTTGQGTLAFNPAEAATTTLTLNGNMTLGSAANPAFLSLNTGASSVDTISIAGTLTVNAGGATLSLNALAGTTLGTGGSPYTLLSFTSGSNVAGITFAGGKTTDSVSGNLYTLTPTSTAETLVVSALAAPATAVWYGINDASWATFNSSGGANKTNWVTTATGTIDAGGTPASTTNVIFSTSGGGGATHLATTLDANTTIANLTFNNTSGTVSIGPGSVTTNTLTIGSASVAGSGNLTLNSGAGAITLSAPIILGVANIWTNNAANSLTASNTITGNGNNLQLTGGGNFAISGNIVDGSPTGTSVTVNNSGGTVTLSGTNSYTGTTTLTAGTLVGTSAALVGNIATSGGSTLILDQTAVTPNLASGTFTGVISGTGAIMKNNAGIFIVANNQTYTGVTTLNGGTLSVVTLANGGNPSGIGQAPNLATNLIFNGGTLQAKPTAAQSTDHLFSIGLTGATLDSSGAAAASTVTFSNTGALATPGAGPRTLTLTGTNLGTVTAQAAGEYTGAGGLNTVASVINDQAPTTGVTSLTKTGTGSWVLTSANGYSGPTTVSAGDLAITNGASLGTSNVSVAAGAQLTFSNVGITVANNITLNGTTNYNGLVGALVGDNLGGGGANILSGTLTLNATSNVSTSWNDKSLTIQGLITGAGGLQVDLYHAGNLASAINITGTANTYLGPTILNAGILNVALLANGNAPSSIGQSSNAVTNVIFNGGTLNYTGGTVSIDRGMSVNAGNGTISVQNAAANLTTTGQITAVTNGLLTFPGPGTFTIGGTGDNGNLSATVSGGTLILAKSPSGPGGTGAGARSIGTLLTVAGGTAQLSGTGGDQVFDGASVTVTSGAFDTNGLSETFTNLRLAGTGLSAAGALVNTSSSTTTSLITPSGGTTLTANASIGVTNSAASLTLANPISGAFTLTKVGPGALSLTGNNTYTLGTNVSAGTLLAMNIAGSATGTAASTVTVAASATLGGGGTILGATTLTGATLAPSAARTTQVGTPLTITGNLSLDSASTLGIRITSATAGSGYDQVVFGGTIALNGASLQLTDAAYKATNPTPGAVFWIVDGSSTSSPVPIGSLSFGGVAIANGATFTSASGITYQANYDASGDPLGTSRDVQLVTTAIPEPATLSLMGLGAVGLLARRRRVTV